MHGTYVQEVCKCGILGVCHQKFEMSVSGTFKIRVKRKSVGFFIKLHLVKGIVGGNSKDSSDIWFGK